MPQTTEDVKLDSRFFCLFKGDPGTGKSIAAASYPGIKVCPQCGADHFCSAEAAEQQTEEQKECKKRIGPYFMDNDGRMKSVVNYWRPRGREFHFDRFTSFLALNRNLENFYNFSCPYWTLVYDGITTGSDQILDDLIETRDPASKKNTRAGIEFLQIEDFNGESRGLSVIINNLKAISFRYGVNVIVTAHVLTTEATDIKTKVTTVSRSLLTAGKKVAAKLPVHFDECYHFDIQTGMSMGPEDKPSYTIITRNVGQDWAKTAMSVDTRIVFTDGSLYDILIEQQKRKTVQPVNSSW
jgi:hypothetical protein